MNSTLKGFTLKTFSLIKLNSIKNKAQQRNHRLSTVINASLFASTTIKVACRHNKREDSDQIYQTHHNTAVCPL